MGQGSFGTIYIGYDLLTNEEVIDFAMGLRSPCSPSTLLAHPQLQNLFSHSTLPHHQTRSGKMLLLS